MWVRTAVLTRLVAAGRRVGDLFRKRSHAENELEGENGEDREPDAKRQRRLEECSQHLNSNVHRHAQTNNQAATSSSLTGASIKNNKSEEVESHGAADAAANDNKLSDSSFTSPTEALHAAVENSSIISSPTPLRHRSTNASDDGGSGEARADENDGRNLVASGGGAIINIGGDSGNGSSDVGVEISVGSGAVVGEDSSSPSAAAESVATQQNNLLTLSHRSVEAVRREHRRVEEELRRQQEEAHRRQEEALRRQEQIRMERLERKRQEDLERDIQHRERVQRWRKIFRENQETTKRQLNEAATDTDDNDAVDYSLVSSGINASVATQPRNSESDQPCNTGAMLNVSGKDEEG